MSTSPETPPPQAEPTIPVTPELTAEPVPSPSVALVGSIFVDQDGDTIADPDEPGAPGVEVLLSGQHGFQQVASADDRARFRFQSLPPGIYSLTLRTPVGFTVSGQHPLILLWDGQAVVPAQREITWDGVVVRPLEVGIKLEPTPTPAQASPQGAADGAESAPTTPEEGEPPPDREPTETEMGESEAAEALASAEEQSELRALSTLTQLPLRFAPGRNALAQVQGRSLAGGVVWLGVPFRTQIDGTEFQFVNCGPASLAMVMAAFGLEVQVSHIRDYLNTRIGNFNPNVGTGLDVLSTIAREAGLTPIDLYQGGGGGYRAWSIEAIRWHIQQGHPVITLVKYRDLPGHGLSPFDSDHYIVITGLTSSGFIYNDAAFPSSTGYGLEISHSDLEQAWQNTSIPRHAVAFGLTVPGGALTFPGQPTPQPTPSIQDVWSRVSTALRAGERYSPIPWSFEMDARARSDGRVASESQPTPISVGEEMGGEENPSTEAASGEPLSAPIESLSSEHGTQPDALASAGGRVIAATEGGPLGPGALLPLGLLWPLALVWATASLLSGVARKWARGLRGLATALLASLGK